MPTRELSLAPYLAARLRARPKHDDGIRNAPRLLEPSADLGLDLRTSLGPGLSLQGTINPDFGQVEADQLQLNLSTYELFFPEKRPFFTQGLDLFQGPAPHNQPSPQQLFYSRRIGLDAPILGAAKVTGRLSDSLQLGLVEAVVAGAGAPAGFDPEHPSRAVRLDPRQPLTLAPASALPALEPAARNFLSAVLRWQPSALATFGLAATSALPLGPRCDGLQANTDPDDPVRVRPARCDVLTGNGLALDWNVRSPGGIWFLRGQASASQYLGGLTDAQVDPGAGGAPLAVGRRRTLADGTVLRPGDLGAGAFLAFGKNGGEPWRFDVDLEWESPRLDLNAVGYQRTQDELKTRAILRYVRPTGGGPFNSWAMLVGGDARRSADGSVLTSAVAFWELDLELKSFHGLSLYVDAALPAWDRREIDGSGLSLQRPGGWSANLSGWTDQGQALSAQGNLGGGRNLPLAGVRTVDYWYARRRPDLARPRPRADRSAAPPGEERLVGPLGGLAPGRRAARRGAGVAQPLGHPAPAAPAHAAPHAAGLRPALHRRRPLRPLLPGRAAARRADPRRGPPGGRGARRAARLPRGGPQPLGGAPLGVPARLDALPGLQPRGDPADLGGADGAAGLLAPAGRPGPRPGGGHGAPEVELVLGGLRRGAAPFAAARACGL